jgi:hypothetical protein
MIIKVAAFGLIGDIFDRPYAPFITTFEKTVRRYGIRVEEIWEWGLANCPRFCDVRWTQTIVL